MIFIFGFALLGVFVLIWVCNIEANVDRWLYPEYYSKHEGLEMLADGGKLVHVKQTISEREL